MAARPKTHKVQIYYPKATRQGKFETLTRHFIHKPRGGFWVAVRDLTAREQFSNGATNIQNTVIFEINHHPVLLGLWQDLIIMHNGKFYKIDAKPDQYDHITKQLKMTATEFTDNSEYAGDEYGG